MILQNDKIVMVKPIQGCDMVGQVFVISNITEDGVISFTASFDKGIGKGIMSLSDYETYFEKVIDTEPEPELDPVFSKPAPLVWTDWILCQDVNFEKYGDSDLLYKTNGRRTKVKYENLIGQATCHPDDEFNIETALDFCIARIQIKYGRKRLAELLNS